MNVIHLSAECYPVAKTGGLGDVVGALPKYQCQVGVNAAVVMPYYDRKFVREHTFDTVFEADSRLGDHPFHFHILKERTGVLGFDLYLVHIPGLLDRPEVYMYPDESEQFIAYQISVLDWLSQSETLPDLVHCHDHHAGLVPFLMTNSGRYTRLAGIPTVVTVHNAQYQGWLGWDKLGYLPDINLLRTGLLDWNGCINPLAAAIKCCWHFTAVSPTYLRELSWNSNGLEYLFAGERQKGTGIINGIDVQVWDPQNDPMVDKSYTWRSVAKGKQANKTSLVTQFGLDPKLPLLAFIGRLVGEKGADLLPAIFEEALSRHPHLSIVALGSGEPEIEEALRALQHRFPENYYADIGYNEVLSHKIYATADFLIMPSRVEPCGLNQLYALRYGTVPVVRSTGGLIDTVVDVDQEGGYGIRFDESTVESAVSAIDRAVALFAADGTLDALRKKMMRLNFSWDNSASQYIHLYTSLITN